MESKYSQLEKNDARFTFFHKCIQVYDNILLLYIIRKFYLPNKEFFNKHKGEITLREGLEEQFMAEHGNIFNNLDNEEEKKHAYFYNLLANEIDSFTIFTFFQGIFVAFESTFRLIFPTIKKREPPNNISNVLDELKLDLGLSDYSKFFDLLRNLRNSIHNNGVYTQKNDEIVWNGFKYEFIKSKPIEIENLWDKWFDIVNEFINIMEIIFTKTKNIPTILDPMIMTKSRYLQF
jgi:hypothetical protein